jgi:hypothetical protein
MMASFLNDPTIHYYARTLKETKNTKEICCYGSSSDEPMDVSAQANGCQQFFRHLLE